jgi:hypothetical protein
MGEYIATVSAGITTSHLAMASLWQYNLKDIAHLLDNVIGLSRELSEDPVVLLTLCVNDQLVLILNHSTDGISTCAVIGNPDEAFISYACDEESPGIYYVDLRVDLDESNMSLVDSMSRGGTLTQLIEMNDSVNQELLKLI